MDRPQYFIILADDKLNTLLNTANNSMKEAADIQGKRCGTSSIPLNCTSFAASETTTTPASAIPAW